MNEESFMEKKKKLEEDIKQSDSAINRIVLDIQNGDKKSREILINYYKPFIIKCVSVTLGKFCDVENSEEYSVGLIAFDEAIDKFNEDKYGKFLNFAKLVIKRRVIDYLRYNNKINSKLVFTLSDESSDHFDNGYLSLNPYEQFREVEYREEMHQFEKVLNDFNIAIEELVEIVPKHTDAVESCINIAKILADNNELFNHLVITQRLPLSDLAKLSKVSKRTLQRNEHYIIAVSLIFRYNFELFRSYVNGYKNKHNSNE